MTQNFKQIMYCNDTSTKNHPNNITAEKLINGSAFSDYMPLTQLGIQALPGTKFYINGNNNPVIVGFTGIFDIDLTKGGSIISLTFDRHSIAEIQANDSAFLIVDMAYLEG